VEVEFCALGNYRRPAERLARAVREESGAAAELVPGRGGVFEVTVAGELVFSKRATARLPETEEILYHVRAALARNPR
jgi:selenoprotein W-related protein